MILEELKKRRIKLTIKEIISDFELNIMKSVDELLVGIIILGCFFHLLKAMWAYLQQNGFATHFDRFPDFHRFIKSSFALAHLPLEDIEAGLNYLKEFELVDQDCRKFKEKVFIPYIENTWINGQFPPGIWNCNARSEDSNTNNNQEGYNSRINKELKQIHPNPWILTSFIKKQIKLSEQEIIKVKCGLSKPKRRKVYKKLAERRKNLRQNYKRNKDIPNFLFAMGSNLVSAELAAGNSTDPVASVNPDNGADDSHWKEHDEEEDDSIDVTPTEYIQNPYAGRKIGKRPVDRPRVGRSKCTVCDKGFNSKSNSISCHACDKQTHVRCIKDTFDEEQFYCRKCRPIQTTVEDAIAQEMLIDAAVENPTLSHGENSINCDNGLKDFLQKLERMNLLEKFENELVTLDMLKEMNHEDLKSIGIITFGHRHKILKEIMSYRPPNIVETIVNSAEFQFGCVNCEENFYTHDALRDG